MNIHHPVWGWIRAEDAPADEVLQMRERCADCAFRTGTTAHSTPLQVEKAMLCVQTGTMFFCHEHPDTHGSSKVLCKGFVDAFTAKMRSGFYDHLPDWKRRVLVIALDAIEKVEDGEQVDLMKMIREATP